MTRAPPRNRLDRAQRLARWEEAAEEGRRNHAQPLEDKDARYRWRKFAADSDLPYVARLMVHTIALYGRADGSSIYPGTRELERSSGLSSRSVADQLDLLVRRGWLTRRERQAGRAWTMGVVYQLCVPLEVLEHAKDSTKRLRQPPKSPSDSGAESPTAPRAERATAPRAEAHTARAHGGGAVDGSVGAVHGAQKVLSHVQPILNPIECSECPPSRTGDAPNSAGDESQSRAEPEAEKHAAPRLDPEIERDVRDLVVNKGFTIEQIARINKYRAFPLASLQRCLQP